jgi:hypothetical protein
MTPGVRGVELCDVRGSHKCAADCLHAALDYASRGWPVVPMHEPSQSGCCSCRLGSECRSSAKHPRTAHGVKDGTTDLSVIRAWWMRCPRANVGILTGTGSGIIVLDVDPRNGGTESLARLQSQIGGLPETVTVATGGGGMHFYLRHPGGHIRSREMTGFPGIDVKGDGGIVIAPPSVHISGCRYAFVTQSPFQGREEHTQWGMVAQLPEAVAALLNPPRRAARPSMSLASELVSDWTRYGQVALSMEYQRVRGAVRGTRNMTLNRAAFSLGQLIAGNQVDGHLATQVLMQAALDAGLSEPEASRTLTSGLDAGMRHPRTPSSDPMRTTRTRSGSSGHVSAHALWQQ